MSTVENERIGAIIPERRKLSGLLGSRRRKQGVAAREIELTTRKDSSYEDILRKIPSTSDHAFAAFSGGFV